MRIYFLTGKVEEWLAWAQIGQYGDNVVHILTGLKIMEKGSVSNISIWNRVIEQCYLQLLFNVDKITFKNIMNLCNTYKQLRCSWRECLPWTFSCLKTCYDDGKNQQYKAKVGSEKLKKQVLDRHRLDSDMCNIKRNYLSFTASDVISGGCGNQDQQYKLKLWTEKFCKN